MRVAALILKFGVIIKPGWFHSHEERREGSLKIEGGGKERREKVVLALV